MFHPHGILYQLRKCALYTLWKWHSSNRMCKSHRDYDLGGNGGIGEGTVVGGYNEFVV